MPSAPSVSIALVARMVKAAARHSVFRPSCLEESLTLWWLLSRGGLACDLRIGVNKDGSKFAAHAWVESAGGALNEPESPHKHYAVFETEFAAFRAETR